MNHFLFCYAINECRFLIPFFSVVTPGKCKLLPGLMSTTEISFITKDYHIIFCFFQIQQVTDSSRHTPSPSPVPSNTSSSAHHQNNNLNVAALAALQTQLPLAAPTLFLQNQLSQLSGLSAGLSNLSTTDLNALQAALQQAQQANFQQQLQSYMLMQGQSGSQAAQAQVAAQLLMQSQVNLVFFWMMKIVVKFWILKNQANFENIAFELTLK